MDNSSKEEAFREEAQQILQGGKLKFKDAENNIKDFDILADFYYNHHLEIDDSIKYTFEEIKEKLNKKLDEGSVYVWKNKDDQIVSFAFYDVLDDKAKTAGVYTPKEERCKGYAANLIYEMTKIIIDKGLVSLLYTEYDYKPSNTAYKNAGYEDKGILINFSCSKNKTRKK